MKREEFKTLGKLALYFITLLGLVFLLWTSKHYILSYIYFGK